VVVIERDEVNVDGRSRAGVPQDRHVHMLLPGGRPWLEHWLPGLTRDLRDRGAVLAGPGQFVQYVDERRAGPTMCCRPTSWSTPWAAGGDAARLDALTGAAVPEDVSRQRWALDQLMQAAPADAAVARALNDVTFMLAHPDTLADPSLLSRAVAANQQHPA
jgi:hypothetical protein